MPALIVITNPVSAATFFVAYLGDTKPKEIRKIAWNACMTAAYVMIIFAIFGTLIFKIFNITLYAFQIAGGIILFGVAIDIRKGRRQDIEAAKASEDFSVTPLAIPMIAGPGAITTCLMLAGEAKDIVFLGVLVCCIMVSLLIMYVILTHAFKISKFLGTGATKIITRLMGLILAVIAIQFVLNGVKAAIPVLAPILSKCLKTYG